MTALPTRFDIQGMHCGSCAGKISAALRALPGVRDATVSHMSGRAEILADPEVSTESLRRAIEGAGSYSASIAGDVAAAAVDSEAAESQRESLYPLSLIVGYIAGATLLIALHRGEWALEPLMRHFMAGFFLVFSFFKLLDPAGFVSAYRGYDLLARRSAAWAWAYPFIELGLGVAYLLALAPALVNGLTLVIMLIGAAGVLRALLDKRAIRCACLGTALNLPMTKVTLVEDLVMAVMAAGMLVMLI